jgi:hypothetical protein
MDVKSYKVWRYTKYVILCEFTSLEPISFLVLNQLKSSLSLSDHRRFCKFSSYMINSDTTIDWYDVWHYKYHDLRMPNICRFSGDRWSHKGRMSAGCRKHSQLEAVWSTNYLRTIRRVDRHGNFCSLIRYFFSEGGIVWE